MPCQHQPEAFDEIRPLKMSRRNINADRPALPRLLPAVQLRQDLIHHPLTDVDDQVGLLHQGQEFSRQHQAVLRMLPPQQSLETNDLATAHVHLRLKMQAQLASGQGLAHPLDRLMGGFDFLVPGDIEQVKAIAPALLGHVHA